MKNSRKMILDNLKLIKKGATASKRFKDYAVQGLQINWCYVDHWDKIKKTSKKYGVDLNRFGPIITLQAYNQVCLAEEITEKIKYNKKIRDMAANCKFPIRTTYYSTDKTDNIIDGTIFFIVYRLIAEFCLRYGVDALYPHLENGRTEYLEKMFSVSGYLIADTIEEVDSIINDMIESMEKPERKKI